MIDGYINALVRYGIEQGLLENEDRVVAVNRLLEVLSLDGPISGDCFPAPLCEILNGLTKYGIDRGLVEDTAEERARFDTRLMGILIPLPREVQKKFRSLYEESPRKATDWYYAFTKSTNYIRTDRLSRDEKWKYQGAYGTLDITINLAKPEKDPRSITAGKKTASGKYPACVLCPENEGYAGRPGHQANQNHRPIPITLDGSPWYFQYSPFVYYPEHCVALSAEHRPMEVNEGTFPKLLDFVTQFPHYFMGSNAGLPIVGGSILSHDHFQGGRYSFAIETAPVETPLTFQGFGDIAAGILKWPVSTLRLAGTDKDRLGALAGKILKVWQDYNDEDAQILSHTAGIPHNTLTPVARRRGEAYELDLVLRNNRTTPERPGGLFHPREELHHIKKENIGLIEVMGLAVLPPRLKAELSLLEEALVRGEPIPPEGILAKHVLWAEELRNRYVFTRENTGEILRKEVGMAFEAMLLDAGVFKRAEEGKQQFLRFAHAVGLEDRK